ncbi:MULTISPECIES: DUF2917 domain-containing protein [unclassified Janthinobacterium]|uniref:DUF2917 domain-containing protein n=1 Tax=unclassified Janthinobacterium TaxID=2610881 RepID=UPI000886CFC0|nr:MULTISPECIES: DUF2917 domain-containing protein [unclassified Janthinobacterium]SDA77276.1 Protein of unknown function [Janthinobacterium sp. 551a]SFB60057.1 Protein of unknown function [Janthinobacterium sp. 344]
MQTDHELRNERPLRLEKARAKVIECLSGTAWITAYAQFEDCVLRSGERYTIPNDGLVLVEAVGSGRIRVHGTAAPRPALLRWLNLALPHPLNTRNT